MKYIPETIGDAVRAYVRMNYRSNKEAARDFGISQSHLSGIVGGTKRPTDKILQEMGMALAYVPSAKLDDSTFPFERRITTGQGSNLRPVGTRP